MSSATETRGQWGQVTPEAAARLRDRIGLKRDAPASFFRYNSNYRDNRLQITPQYVERYATGIADRNPLFVDADYAAASPWGRQLCPPAVLCWLEKVNGATDGFPGCHTIWRGCDLEWERPVMVGDALSSTTQLLDVRLVDSSFSASAAIQDYLTEVTTAEGERVGAYRTSWHRFSREDAKKQSRDGATEPTFWSDEQLAAIAQEYREQNTQRRAATPRFWEDVAVGEQLPHLIKGPTTLTSKIAFEAINFPGGWVLGHELALELFEEHPNLPIRNEENALEPPVAIHWTNERCQRYLGMPKAYEAGYERLHWLGQLLMNWSGDAAMMRKLSVQYRNFHWQGDVIRLHATVTETRVDDGQHLVDLSIETKTHRDETTTIGSATVQLPSRTASSLVLPRS